MINSIFVIDSSVVIKWLSRDNEQYLAIKELFSDYWTKKWKK